MNDLSGQRQNRSEAESADGGVGRDAGAATSQQLSNAEDAINRRIFETSLDLILVCDKQGTLSRVSPSAQRILGYDPAEMAGRSGKDFLYPPDLDNTREEMRRARRGGEMRNFECAYVHRDGRVVPLAWTGVWSEAEQQHFFIGRDITDRKEIEERLRHAQRMEAIGNLTGGMAHDFNNLLGIIIGNLDLLRGGELTAQAQELVGDAIDAAVRGADLTRRLLAFARRQQLDPKDVALNELVGGIVGLLRRTLGEATPIALNLDDGVWPVHADPAQLEAALVNLATNARDAMPEGGRLMIATANRTLDGNYAALHPELSPGDYAMIEVSDTGTGIPPEVIDRIFEPFFTTKEPGKGTGLGLSMVFGFIKQSGGHINVYSEPGAGTTFRLYLPRRDAAVAVTAAAPTRAPSVLTGNETVLLVEDNEGMRRVAKRQLIALGYRVVEADQAAAALDVLATEDIDLLLSDIVMPGEINGFELARLALAQRPALKIVLTSGFPEARLKGNGEAVAGTRLLSKPYRREDLAHILRETLDASGSPDAS